MDAVDLRVGERLRSDDGDRVTVRAARSYTGAATMHDLTVADIHTYYVMAGTTPVLVHNCGPGGGLSQSALDDAFNAANTPENLGHVIDPAKHGFGDIVNQAGGRSEAMREITNSLRCSCDLPAASRFEVQRVIYGETVTIRGAMVNSVPRIGTAFVPSKFPGTP